MFNNEPTQDTKLDWIYNGPNSTVEREEYLLGRSVDKTLEQLNEEEKLKQQGLSSQPRNKVEHECIPPSMRDFNKGVQAEQVDLSTKLQEDPLVEIKKRQEESRRQFLQNPVQLKKLQKALKAQELKKTKKTKKKKSKKSRDSDIELKLIEKFQLGTDLKLKKGESALDIILFHKYEQFKSKLTADDLRGILEGKITDSEESDDEEKEEKKSSKNKAKYNSEESEDESDDNKYKSRKDFRKDFKKYPNEERYHKKEYNENRNRDYNRRNDNDRNERDYNRRNDDDRNERDYNRRNDDDRNERDYNRRNDYEDDRNDYRRRDKEYDNRHEYKRSNDDRRRRHDSYDEDKEKNKTRSKDNLKLKRSDSSDDSKNKKDKKRKVDSKVKHYDSSDDDRKHRDHSRNKKDKKEIRKKKEVKKSKKKEKSRKKSSSESSTSSSSSSEEEIRPSKKYDSEDSDTEKKIKTNYGLVTSDGAKIPLKGVAPQKTNSNKAAPAPEPPKKIDKNRVKRLTEEEKDKLRQEMSQNAIVRDKERSHNLKKYRETEKRESNQQDYDPDFVHKQLVKSTNSSTVESRIKSNLNNIQRSSRDMDKHFSRRN